MSGTKGRGRLVVSFVRDTKLVKSDSYFGGRWRRDLAFLKECDGVVGVLLSMGSI